MKLARQLAASTNAPVAPPGLVGDLAVLGRAVLDLGSLRADGEPASDSPLRAVHFERARRALARHETAAAGEAIAALATLPGLELGARWLAASLLAIDSTTRPKAIEFLRRVIEDTQSPAARHALAARSLGAGGPVGTVGTARRPGLCGPLRGGPRLARRPHRGRARAGGPLARSHRADPRLTPLAAAAASASRSPEAPLELVCGDDAARTATILGRAIVAGRAEGADAGMLRVALEAHSMAQGDDPLVSALEAELALSAGAAVRIAQVVSDGPSAEDPKAARDKHLARGSCSRSAATPTPLRGSTRARSVRIRRPNPPRAPCSPRPLPRAPPIY